MSISVKLQMDFVLIEAKIANITFYRQYW